MTDTHKIRSPEWSHIRERDNQIIDLKADVEQLREEQKQIARILRCPDAGHVITTPSNLPNVVRDKMAEVERLQSELAEEVPCELCKRPLAEQAGCPVCWSCHCADVERLQQDLSRQQTEMARLRRDLADAKRALPVERAFIDVQSRLRCLPGDFLPVAAYTDGLAIAQRPTLDGIKAAVKGAK